MKYVFCELLRSNFRCGRMLSSRTLRPTVRHGMPLSVPCVNSTGLSIRCPGVFAPVFYFFTTQFD